MLAARKAKRNKRFRPNVARFNANLEKNLIELREELVSGVYMPGLYRERMIFVPKERKISAAPYRDRVAHHALINVIEPIWERSFIYDSYACRKGKGTHAALTRIEPWLMDCRYVLKCDIMKYFPCIDHEILKSLMRRKIKCGKTLELMDRIIDHSNLQDEVYELFPGDDLFSTFERRKGLPIGNQTSQFFANVYLDLMDHYLKDVLGHRRYARYCDDFLIFGNDKKNLWDARADIARFLESLRLRLHENKSTVMRCDDGVPFLGFCCYPGYRKLDKGNFTRYRRGMFEKIAAMDGDSEAIENLRRSWRSWRGHAMWGKTYGLRNRFAGEIRERLKGRAD